MNNANTVSAATNLGMQYIFISEKAVVSGKTYRTLLYSR